MKDERRDRECEIGPGDLPHPLLLVPWAVARREGVLQLWGGELCYESAQGEGGR